MPWDTTEHDRPPVNDDGSDEPVIAGTPVVVRRHAGVAALIGAAASAVAIAYLWRASQTMAALDWTLCGVMAVIAGVYLAALVDARTPLLVADDLGVRIRLGDEWRGLPWEAIGKVVVHPRSGLLRDGRLVFSPRSLARALDGVEGRARRHVALNQKMYGAPLAVPLGFTTRVSGDADLVEQVNGLAHGRSEVVELDPRTLDVVDHAPVPATETVESRAAEGRADVEVPHTAGDAGPDERLVARSRWAALLDRLGGPRRDEVVDPEVEVPLVPWGAEPTDDGWLDEGPAADAVGDHASADPDNSGNDQDLEEPAAGRDGRRRMVGGIGTIVSRVAKGRARDTDRTGDDAPVRGDGPVSSPAGPDPLAPKPLSPAAALDSPSAPSLLRETRSGSRAEATLPTAGTSALDLDGEDSRRGALLPEGRELRRPGSVDLVEEPVQVDVRVRPISTMGDPVEPIVIDDFVVEPAYDPVIGPELTAARTRLGLSVDELAERTRIRPHVIESIEVDDFAPCGGDFYARGHLRTLARILGKDADPLLATFEERYASAPINARRVFEAELATGMTGSMRSTVGGPSWSLLVGVVLTLVLVWGVVRLFTTDPVEMVEVPAPILNGSAGVVPGVPVEPGAGAGAGPGAAPATDPVPVRLSASQSDTAVVVRDGDGAVVFSGDLVLGERRTLQVVPPVRIRAEDGGALEVRIDGRDRGLLGTAGEPARRTFR